MLMRKSVVYEKRNKVEFSLLCEMRNDTYSAVGFNCIDNKDTCIMRFAEPNLQVIEYCPSVVSKQKFLSFGFEILVLGSF